tara:strand:- start:475 stop:705 length:231 start_codon:yes stop_codon:yes gene_type:complete
LGKICFPITLFRDKTKYISIGYARQSTHKQIYIDAQVEDLKRQVSFLFSTRLSQLQIKQKKLEASLETLEEGDEFS